jgi:hypothetical protein
MFKTCYLYATDGKARCNPPCPLCQEGKSFKELADDTAKIAYEFQEKIKKQYRRPGYKHEVGYPNELGLYFNARFEDHPTGNKWSGLPKDLCEFLEKPEGIFSGIEDKLLPEKDYIVSISIQEL